MPCWQARRGFASRHALCPSSDGIELLVRFRRGRETLVVETTLLAIAGPVLGLSGTLLGIWYGHRRWHTEREDEHGDFYRKRQREAYAGLWEVVQEAHLSMRTSLDGLDSDVFSAFLTNVNAFGWRQGVYIEDSDRELAQEYLFLVYEFLRLVASNDAGRRWIMSTAPRLPGEIPETLRAMKLAEAAAEGVREKLANRIRAVLGAIPTSEPEGGKTSGARLATRFNQLLEQEPSAGAHAASHSRKTRESLSARHCETESDEANPAGKE